MKLEELEIYNRNNEADTAGNWYHKHDVELLYKFQQDIINKLVSNFQSQFETNQILVNRLLELKSWLFEMLNQAIIAVENNQANCSEVVASKQAFRDALLLVNEKIN